MAVNVALTAVYVGLVLLVAKFFEDMFRRVRLPSFVGAILAGYLLGPGGFNIVKEEYVKSMGLLLVVGVDFLLFLAGAEELSHLRGRFKLQDIVTALLLLTLTSCSVAILVKLLSPEVSLSVAALVGLTMGIVSLGPLMKALIDAGLVSAPEALRVARIALLAEVGGILTFNALYGGHILYHALVTVVAFAIVYVLGRKLLTKLLYFVEDVVSAREAPFAVIVALVLLASYLAEVVGFNAAVTALMLGLFASSYLEERPVYLERLKAFTYGFLEPLFFAGIGLKAPTPTFDVLYTTAVLLAATAAPKLIVASIAGLMPVGVTLLAKGGVDAALLLTLLESPKHELSPNLYAACVLTMLGLTTIMALAIRQFIPQGRTPKEPWRMRVAELGLGFDVVRRTDDLLTVSIVLSASSSGAVVVIDENGRPIGYITAADLIYVSPSEMSRLTAEEVMREDVPVIEATARATELLKEHVMAEPIVAVVDQDGHIIGTISPHRVLQRLYKLRKSK